MEMKITIWLGRFVACVLCAFAVHAGIAQIPNVPHPDKVPPDGSTAANPTIFPVGLQWNADHSRYEANGAICLPQPPLIYNEQGQLQGELGIYWDSNWGGGV